MGHPGPSQYPVQRLRLGSSSAGAQVQSLVREVRSHRLCGTTRKEKKDNGSGEKEALIAYSSSLIMP